MKLIKREKGTKKHGTQIARKMVRMHRTVYTLQTTVEVRGHYKRNSDKSSIEYAAANTLGNKVYARDRREEEIITYRG